MLENCWPSITAQRFNWTARKWYSSGVTDHRLAFAQYPVSFWAHVPARLLHLICNNEIVTNTHLFWKLLYRSVNKPASGFSSRKEPFISSLSFNSISCSVNLTSDKVIYIDKRACLSTFANAFCYLLKVKQWYSERLLNHHNRCNQLVLKSLYLGPPLTS